MSTSIPFTFIVTAPAYTPYLSHPPRDLSPQKTSSCLYSSSLRLLQSLPSYWFSFYFPTLIPLVPYSRKYILRLLHEYFSFPYLLFLFFFPSNAIPAPQPLTSERRGEGGLMEEWREKGRDGGRDVVTPLLCPPRWERRLLSTSIFHGV